MTKELAPGSRSSPALCHDRCWKGQSRPRELGPFRPRWPSPCPTSGKQWSVSCRWKPITPFSPLPGCCPTSAAS